MSNKIKISIEEESANIILLGLANILEKNQEVDEYELEEAIKTFKKIANEVICNEIELNWGSIVGKWATKFEIEPLDKEPTYEDWDMVIENKKPLQEDNDTESVYHKFHTEIYNFLDEDEELLENDYGEDSIYELAIFIFAKGSSFWEKIKNSEITPLEVSKSEEFDKLYSETCDWIWK